MPVLDSLDVEGGVVVGVGATLQATHSLVTELSAVAANESSMLNEYRELLGTAAALQHYWEGNKAKHKQNRIPHQPARGTMKGVTKK
uniref:Uncharacterized protein n=1 Tax=Oryza barthii TaxID=65489 RepID=A0A0D3FBJ3_9ORYZ